jgi:hypothetical protein
MDRQIAFVLLDQPATLDIEGIARAVRARHPEMPVEVVAASAQNGHGTAQSPLIRCGDDLVTVMNVPAPLPQDPGEEVWERAAKAWPQARTVAKRHRAHVIVATIGKVASPLRDARVVTAVIGGLLDIVPQCSAVMWAARVVRSATQWKDESRNAFAPYPNYPFLLWIDITAIRTGAGIDAVTVGLSSFVDREIEFEVGQFNPTNVLNNVAGLAGYLIENGNVVKDGDTFGGSDAERIRIRHAVSTHRRGVPVLRVAAAGGARRDH